MKRSTRKTGLVTTHVGSLPRPPDLLEMIQAKERGEPFDAAAFAAASRARSPRSSGGKPSRHRHRRRWRDGAVRVYPLCQRAARRHRAAPEPARRRQLGAVARTPCVSRVLRLGGADAGRGRRRAADPMGLHRPDRLQGREALARDIDNLKAALARVTCEEAFMPAVSPLISPIGTGTNTTRPTRNSGSRWPTRCTRNTGRSSMPASSCRSMTRSWRATGRCTRNSTLRSAANGRAPPSSS